MPAPVPVPVPDRRGPTLLAITPPSGPCDPVLVATWRDAGATTLHLLLRRPGATVAAQLADPALRALHHAAAEHGVPCLVSCAPDDHEGLHLAHAAGLAGVQLRGDANDDAVARARGAGLSCVGVSVHGPPRPTLSTADWVAFAPVFAPRTIDPVRPPKTPAGLPTLRKWTATGAWVVALGGITAANADAVVAAGARGLASIRSFFGPPGEVRDNVGALCRALRAAPPSGHAPSPQT